MKQINLLNTIQGSLFENFFPSAWDLKKIDECCSNTPEDVNKRESWWHKDFQPVAGESLDDLIPMVMKLLTRSS